ncbi:CHU large protein [Nonlabens dokdonensis DSW-6]|uniref:CHU large protein n=1 Tax=Nonlabens dokdonensis (strain DSM 17205 / KCTC 12402 / DSW-6) TaxID=592029 RepID=L7WF92_NONDD|nr:CHU large protein [Nonlabens dokdonensis DSW-6]
MPITFRGQSGVRPYTFEYRLGSGMVQTVTTVGNSNTVVVDVPTTNLGAQVYELISVSDQISSATLTPGQFVTIDVVLNDLDANFTFNNNVCSGQPVNFSTSGMGSGTLMYEWDFGDGNFSNVQNPIHIFSAVGSGMSQDFNVTLIVSSSTGCTETVSNFVTIISEPNLNITESPGNPNGAFNNCNNAGTNYSITVAQTGIPTGYNASTLYTIDWGDGTTISNNVMFPISHTYADLGVYNMVVTAPSVAGQCSASQTYQVLNISNPSGGINSPGSTTNICAPSGILDFSISNWGTNSLDTEYRIDFGDGNTVNYSQSQLIAGAPSLTSPFVVPHEYLLTSCPGQYFVNLEIENQCSITTGQVGPISVISETIADFVNIESACVSNQVTFFNTSEVGFGPNCSSDVFYTWDYGDGTTPIEVPSPTPLNGVHTYTTPGTYTVTLSTNSACGMDSVSNQICIENPIVPDFVFDTIEGCFPVQVSTTNNTITSDACSPLVYQWNVSYQDIYCGSLPEVWSFTNGTNINSPEPSFEFITPGVYTLQSTISGSSCGDVVSTPQDIVVKQPPIVTINPINDICNNAGSNLISFTAAVDNCAPLTSSSSYLWSFPGGVPSSSTDPNPLNIAYNAPGTYFIDLTVDNECGPTTANTVSFTIHPETSISGNLSVCQGETTQLTSSTMGNSWLSTDTSIAIVDSTGAVTGITGGTTLITFIDENGCDASVNFDVLPAPVITTQPLSNQQICLGGTTTDLSFSIASGGGTLTYQWYSNTINSVIGGTSISGATSAVFTPPNSPLGVNYYYCEIFFSQGGCTSVLTQVAQVEILPIPTIVNQPTQSQELCVGGIISPLTLSFMDGAGTVTYQWFSNTVNSNNGGTLISGADQMTYTPSAFTTAGTFYYYVEINFSASGCGTIISDPAEVIVVDEPVITSQPVTTQTHCQGAMTDTLSVTSIGGLGNFSYQWFSNTSNTTIGGTLLTGETSNSYIPDASIVGTTYFYCEISQTGLGCDIVSDVAEVIIIPAPVITNQPIDDSICLGESINPLSVTVTNGASLPNYQWYSNVLDSTVGGSPIVGANADTYQPPNTNLGTIYYYCEISFSSGGCPQIFSDTAEVTISDFPSIANQNYVICTTDVFTMDPLQGGMNTVPANTTYVWTILTNSPTGVVTGATNETVPQSDFTQNLTNSTTQVGTVVYAVTPVAGSCSGNNFTVSIDVFPTPIVDFSINDQTLCNSDTSTSVSLSSTIVGNVSYSWTANVPAGITGVTLSGTDVIPVQTLNNSTTVPLTVVYTATATFNTGASSCQGPANDYSITVNPEITTSTIVSDFNGFNVSSFGANDGSIDLTVSGGTGNFSYNWIGPNGFIATTEDINSLVAGNYQVTIDDGSCAPIILDFVLIEPAELLFEEDLSVHLDLECFGDMNGAIGVNITQESIAPYTFEIINASGTVVGSVANSNVLSQTFTGLSGGIFTVRITDGNGGITELSGLEILQPDMIMIAASQTSISCFGADDASITLNVSGGNGGPYTADWSNLATGFFQANLGAGTYDITVTDRLGCTELISIVIPQAPIFDISPIVENISCIGANDGSIALNLVGGLQPITLTWNDGSTSGVNRNNLGPGTYTVTIEDGTPCFITETFIIIEPQALVVDANVTNALDCNNGDTGAINLIVSGGTPPYTYNWSNGAITEDLNNISSGNYLVTVTDSEGCIEASSFTVVRPAPIELSVTDSLTVDCDTSTVEQNFEAVVSGGVAPFTFNWSNGNVSGANNQFMSTNQNGLIILEAVDSRGCIGTFNFDVDLERIGEPSFNSESIGFITLGEYSILDPIQFTNTSTEDFNSISWDFGDGAFSNDENPIHTYTTPGQYTVIQTVVYGYGCIKTFVRTLFITKGYKLLMPTAFTPNDDGLNDNFRPIQEGLEELRFDIYDTWGSLIFSESGATIAGWNGLLNDREAENGNYYFKLTAKTFYGEEINAEGAFIKID